MITLFTDGACRGNPGPGGWAAILRIDGQETELSGGDPSTTNNRMELIAVIEGLSRIPEGSEVRVVSDSQYVVKGISEWVPNWIRRGWRKADRKPVLNQELWQRLVSEAERCHVTWQWVEGHAGHAENERCDRLANEAIDDLGGLEGRAGTHR